jgi:hypothetical protein
MGYIGNSYLQQSIIPATDFFSGNGATTTFTLTRPVTSVYAIEVVVNNVQQNPANAYTINTLNQLVLTGAPSTGTNNIYVNYNAAVAQANQPGQGTVGNQQLGSISNINSANGNMTLQTNGTTAVTIDQSQNIILGTSTATNTRITGNITTMSGTGALVLPSGTSAQRPSVLSNGMARYNQDALEPEWYGPAGWLKFREYGGPGSSSTNPATSPQQLANLGVATGTYWFLGTGQSAARQLYYRYNYYESKSWVRVFSSPFAGTATVNEVGYSIPWKGFFLQRDSEDYRGTGYFTTYQTFNTRSDTATATSGSYSGYRIYIGQAGGHGFYNTGQSPCNWSNGVGSLGAGYDGSCGSWPNAVRWGVGVSGQPQYSNLSGTVETYIWWD